MKEFKIKVKDVQDFIKTSSYTYASGGNKTFKITLRAGPNMERYIVRIGDITKSFIKVGEAVKFFNEG